MQGLIRIGRHLIPVEHVALIEAYVQNAQAPLRTNRNFKARVVLLNRDSILSEETPEHIAGQHSFRMLSGDAAATNPAIYFRVEEFVPAESFKPAKNYLTRLSWFDLDGNSQSKLLVTDPETVLAIVVRGVALNQSMPAKQPERPRRKRNRLAARAAAR